MKLRTLILIGGLAAAGGGPAAAMGDVAIAPTSYYPGYTPTVLNYAATRGGMLTEVHGSPFEQVPPDKLARLIARLMAASHFGPRTPFVTEAPDGFASPYRVVVVFDPAQTVSSYKVCRGQHRAEAVRDSGTVRVHGVLCANEKPLSAVSGRVRDAEGPSDPKFRKLIGQMSLLLFPPRGSEGDRSDRDVFTD